MMADMDTLDTSRPLNPTLTRRAGMVMWRQIEDALSQEILGERLKGQLPSETELAQRFGVNRHTVRHAVKALVERGLVEIIHGRGSFVREDVIDYQLGRRSRLAHSLAKARRVGSSRVVRSAEVLASPQVQEMLQLPEAGPVVQIESLDMVDGERVVGVCTQYFPLPRFTGIAEVYAELGKTHLALARYGVEDFQRLQSRVTARQCSPELARQLGQPVSAPILYVESVYADAQGLPIEYGISRFSAGAVQVVIEP